jgi:hypothetical protein
VTKHPLYHLEIEALPSTSGTVISRLKRALKMLSWYRLKARSIEEVPASSPDASPGEQSITALHRTIQKPPAPRNCHAPNNQQG